jgi:hypothetical protein
MFMMHSPLEVAYEVAYIVTFFKVPKEKKQTKCRGELGPKCTINPLLHLIALTYHFYRYHILDQLSMLWYIVDIQEKAVQPSL